MSMIIPASRTAFAKGGFGGDLFRAMFLTGGRVLATAAKAAEGTAVVVIPRAPRFEQAPAQGE